MRRRTFQDTDSSLNFLISVWAITASQFSIIRGAAARVRIHTSLEPKKTCRLPALKINKHTRTRLKIETANSQPALAAVKGITKLKCHVSVKQKATSARGEITHSCSCFPFMTERADVCKISNACGREVKDSQCV